MLPYDRTMRAALLVLAVLTGAQEVEHPFRGITHATQTTGPVTIHVVTVDTTAPGVRFKLSPPGGTRETVRQTTLEFLREEHAQVAVNAHFFLPFPSADPDADVIGLAASDGVVYSRCEAPVQAFALVADAPALVIDRGNHAAIVRCAAAADPWIALAGSAQIVTEGRVTVPVYRDARHPDGALTPTADYSNAHSWYDLPRARTAIGLTRDNRSLVLFVVESSASGEASGMAVGEVARRLVDDYGVWNALNLDGGGSTSLAVDGRLVTHGSRAVASSLAIFAERDR